MNKKGSTQNNDSSKKVLKNKNIKKKRGQGEEPVRGKIGEAIVDLVF